MKTISGNNLLSQSKFVKSFIIQTRYKSDSVIKRYLTGFHVRDLAFPFLLVLSEGLLGELQVFDSIDLK